MGKENSLIGKWAEADYFHRINADTKGKVASILVNAISFKGQSYEKKNDLDDIGYLKIKENRPIPKEILRKNSHLTTEHTEITEKSFCCKQ